MQYRLKPEGFAEVRRSIFLRLCVTMALACAGGLLVAKARLDQPVTYFVIGFFVLVTGYSYIRAVARERRSWESFEVRVEEGRITRHVDGYPDFVIEEAELTEVAWGRKRVLEVIAGKKRLTVPAQLQDIEELERRLGAVCRGPQARTS
jgi:hypothetical protein